MSKITTAVHYYSGLNNDTYTTRTYKGEGMVLEQVPGLLDVFVDDGGQELVMTIRKDNFVLLERGEADKTT